MKSFPNISYNIDNKGNIYGSMREVHHLTGDILPENHTYFLRLLENPVQVSFNTQTLKQLHLAQNYPNPFNMNTQIRYELPKTGEVKLCIYNIKGQRIRTLVDSYKKSGEHIAHWDGATDNGNIVTSGLYFYRLRAAGQVKVRKMAVVK